MAKKKLGRKAGDGKGRLGGRAKGTSNKNSGLVRESVEKRLGMSVPDKIMDLLEKTYTVKGDDGNDMEVDAIPDGKKIDKYLDLMQYCYPRLKSIEHKGGGGGLLFDLLAMDPKERQRRIKEIEKRRKK